MADERVSLQTESNTDVPPPSVVPEMTPQARYYLVHHEERLAKAREKYNQRPDVIARRQARAEKGIKTTKEKEEERAVKRMEKAKQLEQKRQMALETKRKTKEDAK